MSRQEANEIRENLASKSSDELLRIWKEHDRERWSGESFEAIRQLLIERGLEAPVPAQCISDEGEVRFLRVLPSTSGFPCMCCGKTQRSLRFRTLRIGIGFIYWCRTRTWCGYICDECVLVGTIVSLFKGILSILLIHPQALLWAPIHLCLNVWSLCFGTKPEPSFALVASDMEGGVITDVPVRRFVELAQNTPEEHKYVPSLILLAVIPILCGYREEGFVKDVQERLQRCEDSGFAKRWTNATNKALKAAGEYQ